MRYGFSHVLEQIVPVRPLPPTTERVPIAAAIYEAKSLPQPNQATLFIAGAVTWAVLVYVWRSARRSSSRSGRSTDVLR